jgi:hypothetical protein
MAGVIGGLLLFASAIAELFGLYSQVSVAGAITVVPVFAWELSPAFRLIIRGFKPALGAGYAVAGDVVPLGSPSP